MTEKALAKLTDKQRLTLDSYKRDLNRARLDNRRTDEKNARGCIFGYVRALLDATFVSDAEFRALYTYYTL